MVLVVFDKVGKHVRLGVEDTFGVVSYEQTQIVVTVQF